MGEFPDYELRVGDVLPLELSGAFSGEALEYTAASSDEDAATVSVSGSTASITGHKAGMATITVTATNTGGSAEQQVVLWILDVPPETVGELPDLTITVDEEPASINLAEAFSGSALVFTGSSSDENLASVSVDGYMATITAVAAGTATVTLTASNSEGSASHVFMVEVLDNRPMAVGMLADITIRVGDDPVAVDVSQAFTGTTLNFSAMSSSEGNATASASGATVTVMAVAAGMATVTVTAMNSRGSADQSFVVTVEDVPPAAAVVLPDVSLVTGGEPAMVDAAAAFSGTALVFTASASGDAVSVSVAGGHVSVAPLVEGEATVTVTATNSAARRRRASAPPCLRMLRNPMPWRIPWPPWPGACSRASTPPSGGASRLNAWALPHRQRPGSHRVARACTVPRARVRSAPGRSRAWRSLPAHTATWTTRRASTAPVPSATARRCARAACSSLPAWVSPSR